MNGCEYVSCTINIVTIINYIVKVRFNLQSTFKIVKMFIEQATVASGGNQTLCLKIMSQVLYHCATGAKAHKEYMLPSQDQVKLSQKNI